MKKILKRFLAAIILLIVTFFSIGIIFPSVNYETKITVNKPVETSFAVFTNPFKLSEWVDGLKGIGLISGFPNTEGSKWKFIIERHGKKLELIQTMKKFKANELFITHADNEFFTDEVKVKFISKGDSTEIIATSRLSGKNIFWKSAFACAQFMLKSQDREMYEKLKEVIEKET